MIRYKYENENELKQLIEENYNLYAVGIQMLKDGNYIVFTTDPYIEPLPNITYLLGSKISILEGEIAELKEFNAKLIQSLNSAEILI